MERAGRRRHGGAVLPSQRSRPGPARADGRAARGHISQLRVPPQGRTGGGRAHGLSGLASRVVAEVEQGACRQPSSASPRRGGTG